MLDRIKLKNVKFHQGMEGYGLNADIYIDGHKVAHVLDEGSGGCFMYTLLGEVVQKDGRKYEDSPERKRNKQLFQEFEEFIKTLPERESGITDTDGKKMTFKPDMDTIIDDLVTEAEMEKFRKKQKKHMEKNILIGVPGSGEYRMSGFKSKKTLKEIATMKGGKEAIQRIVNKMKNDLETGEEILNDNLEELGIKL